MNTTRNTKGLQLNHSLATVRPTRGLQLNHSLATVRPLLVSMSPTLVTVRPAAERLLSDNEV